MYPSARSRLSSTARNRAASVAATTRTHETRVCTVCEGEAPCARWRSVCAARIRRRRSPSGPRRAIVRRMGIQHHARFLRFAQRLALVVIPAAGCVDTTPPRPDSAPADATAEDRDAALDAVSIPDADLPFDSGAFDAGPDDDARTCPAVSLIEPPAPPPPPVPDASDADASDAADGSADSAEASSRIEVWQSSNGFNLQYPSRAVSRCVSTARPTGVNSLSVLRCAGPYTNTATNALWSSTIMGILPCDCTHTGSSTSITCAGDGGADGGESCSLLLPNGIMGPHCEDHLATCDGQTVRMVFCSPAGGALPPPDLDAAA